MMLNRRNLCLRLYLNDRFLLLSLSDFIPLRRAEKFTDAGAQTAQVKMIGYLLAAAFLLPLVSVRAPTCMFAGHSCGNVSYVHI